jgi:transposase
MANRSLVARWVAAYECHGSAGLSKKRSQYSAQFKLSVLQHMWDNRLSRFQTAVKFDVRRHATVGSWERAYREGGFDALVPRAKGKPKKMTTPTTKPEAQPDDDKRSRDELVAELNQLRMENAYLKKLQALVQAQRTATPPKKRK